MRPATVALFLAKVVVLLLLLLLAWQELAMGRAYNALIALLVGGVYQALPFGGHVAAVATEADDFTVRVILGKLRTVLHIVASDITSNTCTLLALYLASPFRSLWRVYLKWLAGSCLVLILLHMITVIAATQSAVAGHPAYGTPPGAWARACAVYLQFYEMVGMYLLVLVLWLPYVVIYARNAGFEEPARGNA